MKQPKKLKLKALDITYCTHATRTCAKCDTCARNLARYATRKTFLLSVFSYPPCEFAASDCAYYLQDARKGAKQ